MTTDRGSQPPTVYLDVDGVVTTPAYQERAGKDALDPRQVAIVAGLVREFGARVVVSSTWRIEDCRPTLVEAGLPAGCFHPDWRTALLPGSRDPVTGAMRSAEEADRGGEISEHAARNRITRYIVLDDVDVGLAHEGRHVRPDPLYGLSPGDDSMARDILSAMVSTDSAMRRPEPTARTPDMRRAGY